MMEPAEEANYPAQVGGSFVPTRKLDITLRQNLEAKIAQVKSRLETLEATKQRLESSGLLEARIDDLRRAMNG